MRACLPGRSTPISSSSTIIEAESSEGISSSDCRWRWDGLWQEKEAERLDGNQPVLVALDGVGPQKQQKVEKQLSFGSSSASLY